MHRVENRNITFTANPSAWSRLENDCRIVSVFFESITSSQIVAAKVLRFNTVKGPALSMLTCSPMADPLASAAGLAWKRLAARRFRPPLASSLATRCLLVRCSRVRHQRAAHALDCPDLSAWVCVRVAPARWPPSVHCELRLGACGADSQPALMTDRPPLLFVRDRPRASTAPPSALLSTGHTSASRCRKAPPCRTVSPAPRQHTCTHAAEEERGTRDDANRL